jgi:hypothetical protein
VTFLSNRDQSARCEIEEEELPIPALRLNVLLIGRRTASIAFENRAVAVTRNQRDFRRVPRLSVNDWSV